MKRFGLLFSLSLLFCSMGLFGQVTNNPNDKIYKDIDQLEKTKFNVKKFSKRYEGYQIFAAIAILSLLLEILLRITILKRLP